MLQAWREHVGNIVADIPGLAQFSSKWVTQRACWQSASCRRCFSIG
jgi:hypothetical protein